MDSNGILKSRINQEIFDNIPHDPNLIKNNIILKPVMKEENTNITNKSIEKLNDSEYFVEFNTKTNENKCELKKKLSKDDFNQSMFIKSFSANEDEYLKIKDFPILKDVEDLKREYKNLALKLGNLFNFS